MATPASFLSIVCLKRDGGNLTRDYSNPSLKAVCGCCSKRCLSVSSSCRREGTSPASGQLLERSFAPIFLHRSQPSFWRKIKRSSSGHNVHQIRTYRANQESEWPPHKQPIDIKRYPLKIGEPEIAALKILADSPRGASSYHLSRATVLRLEQSSTSSKTA